MKTLFFIFIAFFLSSFLYAVTINVPADQPTIQAGINAAVNSDTVLVFPGTYIENINFNGKLITVASIFLILQDTTYVSSTIIDGNQNGSVVTFNNGEDSTAILCGFTITNGKAEGTFPENAGGGIHCDISSPSLHNLIISGNSAIFTDGGGISCYLSSPSLENVTISGNSASFTDGGGISCYLSNPSLENVTISGNTAYENGGGIYCDESSPSLQNVTITGNTASNQGGGIYCDNSSPSLVNVAITGNLVDFGGGIFCYLSNPSLVNVTITDNYASNSGGGIYCHDNSNPILTNSILWNDSPQEIFIGSGSVIATYSDIQGGWTGTGNINVDPLFVDPGNGNYHLQSTSQCIDAGDPASPLDPDGTTADIGAYYFNQYNGPVWHISTTGSDLTGTGWEFNPFATIQQGINFSADTETVLVQPGTYVENINYNGKLITVGSLFLTTQDTSYISSTTIDGNSYGTVVTFENGETSSALLCGFTITNGSETSGGGICCWYDSSPSLQNVTITGNSAVQGGGIFCLENSNPGLQEVTISDNSASGVFGYGGGIYCSVNSMPSLDNVTISGNSASGTFGYGGGIFCYYNSTPSLMNVTITDNYASNSGGGIFCQRNSNPSLINSILWNNSPQQIYFYGDLDPNSITISFSDIQGGEAGITTNNNGTVNWLAGNINADPFFVDSVSGDYHLQSASPCIDAGDPASPLDPDGTIVEMGAYYYDQILNPIPPIADFMVDTTNGDFPLTVNFTDTSEPGTGVIDEWYWEFGDGNNSTLQNPSNEYQLPGNYTVSLTVTDVNDLTDTETKVDYIIVNPYLGPVWHISTTGSDITGIGTEQYPFATIQHGINTSANTDTVLVQPGTYVENIIYFGKLITVASLFLITQDTTYISSTTIDGNSNDTVVKFANGENSSAELCGFTITNGSAAVHGGGILCGSSSSPSLNNLTIINNYSPGSGGGICIWYNAGPILENIIISNNSTEWTGGGIYCYESSLSLKNVIISGNSAGSDGGGIYYHSSSPSLENVTIIGNSAWNGGGIWCGSSSSPSLENVTISGNSAGHTGGGIYCTTDCHPILINSILWNDSPEEICFYDINDPNSITISYSDIQDGESGIITNNNGTVYWLEGNIVNDPLFVNHIVDNYNLLYNSPCINAGDPASPLDPDDTRADMGAYYFDRSPGVPVITAVSDVPVDQGRYAQVIWNRSPYDVSGSPAPIESYSVWRYDDIFGDRGIFEIYEDPQKIFEKAAKDNDKNYYWQRDDEILTFITQLPAMGFAQYSVVSPTLKDSSVVSINYSAFKVFAHTDVTLIYFPSLPDSGYSVDNIAPDETEVAIAKNGTNIGLAWDEVEYGTHQGNSYPEINGIWYKIYAGDSPDFVCDEAHLIDTVTNLNYDYILSGEDKKFFRIVVSDQPVVGRSKNSFSITSESAKDYQKVNTEY